MLLLWNHEKDQFVFQKRPVFVLTNSFKFIDLDSNNVGGHIKIKKKTWKFAENTWKNPGILSVRKYGNPACWTWWFASTGLKQRIRPGNVVGNVNIPPPAGLDWAWTSKLSSAWERAQQESRVTNVCVNRIQWKRFVSCPGGSVLPVRKIHRFREPSCFCYRNGSL